MRLFVVGLGRSWAAPALSQLVETICRSGIQAFHQMPVSVHRDLDRRVSDSLTTIDNRYDGDQRSRARV